ncbi:MAG: M14 family metallopeptidase [Thermoanaerobaculia bacterium]
MPFTNRTPRSAVVLSALLGATIGLIGLIAAAPRADAQAAETPIPPDHYTKAELTSFRFTPSLDEITVFLLRLTTTSPFLHVETFGTTYLGRRMPVVIVSKEKVFTPEDAWKSGRPIVLILNSIHGGEVDGTDASLILLRDIALGNRPEILNGVTLLVVPVYNVDGHERVSKFNRPNQNGPSEGMGFRTNGRGHDLNRDWLKADAPETRALLALAAAWKPDLVIDDHVTDGADFQPTLTTFEGSPPTTPASIGAWLKSVVPAARRQVEEAGYKTAPYIDFIDSLDPRQGVDPGASEPRYSTGYFPLRNIATVLVETHAIKPYADRVKANLHFLRALLEGTASKGKALILARETARRESRGAAVGSACVVAFESDRSRPEVFELPTFAWSEEISPVTGKPVLRYDTSRPMTLPIPLFPYTKPTVSVPRPFAYLIPAGWPEVEERLKAHGIRYEKLIAPTRLEVGTSRASEASLASSPYQGRSRVTATISRRRETRDVPAGSLYVPLDTELARIAIALLEPESPDSLFAWGTFSSVLESKEWIDLRILDPIAAALLAKDPKVKAAWEDKLKDPKFAADARARVRFFYERSPFWDESVGLVPVYRLESPLPAGLGTTSTGGPTPPAH